MKRSVVWGAFVAYAGVVIALTMLKAFFRIGYLWFPERQRIRIIEYIPFDMFIWPESWFGTIFETAGNTGFFIPIGLLACIAVTHTRMRLGKPALPQWAMIRRITLIGFLLSLTIEVSQYIFALGRTDIDDLWANTLGAFIGAVMAVWLGKRWHKVWVILAYVLAGIFLFLVAIGEQLGDPSKIVEV